MTTRAASGLSGLRGLRAWLLVLVIVSFTCGAAAGRLWTLYASAPVERVGAFPDYSEQLSRHFDLSEARRRYLGVILENFQNEERRLEERHLQEFRSSNEPEFRALGLEYDRYIRDHVVPPARRAEYDRLALHLSNPETEDN